MKYTINLYFLYKSLISAQFRRKTLEKRRLRAMPRYLHGISSLLDKPLYFVDANTCYYGYLDIFENEPYRFNATTLAPYIIDCGANIGLSVLYFKHLYPEATICAYEPDPVIYETLLRNIQSFGLVGVECVPAAIWRTNGELDFQIEGGMSGRIPKPEDKGRIRKVSSVRLKDLLDRPVDFLKLDIEGAEYEVILDCKEQLKMVDRLFIEYHSHIREPQSLDEILSILKECGFRYHIHEAYTVRSPFVNSGDMLGMDLQLNIYAWKS